MKVPPDYDRIRELCSKATAADESEAESILSELQAILREHDEFVRQMTATTLNRVRLFQ